MPTSQLSLLHTRRFLPLFLTQFFGAFNDNVYKNALVIWITYQLAMEWQFNAEILITVAAGIFILPFFLFSAIAGELADKFEKSRLIRYTKVAEIGLMLVGMVGFYCHHVFLLMGVLFLLGTQATFFGPLKYSVLPDLLPEKELIAGNAFIETGTFLAILLGTILGGILIIQKAGVHFVSGVILMVSVIGWLCSLCVPMTRPASPALSLRLNPVSATWEVIQQSTQQSAVFISILGISWFWLIGATYLSQFPTYGKDILGAESTVVTLFLTLFSVGVGIGSLLCNRLLKGKIQATFVPLAALGISLFGIDLVFASGVSHPLSAHLITLKEFLNNFTHIRILFDLLMLSVCGGLYIVPLYVIMQQKSEAAYRSRAIASNNIFNALFMVIAAVITSIMLAFHWRVTHVFLLVALLNLGVAFMIRPLKRLV